LIDDLTEAAREAIENAAAEAARAAFLESIEREAAVLHEIYALRMEMEMTRRTGYRNIIISGLLCFAGGMVAGLLISN